MLFKNNDEKIEIKNKDDWVRMWERHFKKSSPKRLIKT